MLNAKDHERMDWKVEKCNSEKWKVGKLFPCEQVEEVMTAQSVSLFIQNYPSSQVKSREDERKGPRNFKEKEPSLVFWIALLSYIHKGMLSKKNTQAFSFRYRYIDYQRRRNKISKYFILWNLQMFLLY